MRKLFLTLYFVCSFGFLSFAQTDSIFWFAAPDLQQSHNDRPIILRLTSYDAPAIVTISQPANSSFVPIQVTLPASSSQSVDLTPFIDEIENFAINTPSNKGLLIKSTSIISCYYDIASGFNGDIFALKGFNALGLKFMVPFQKAYSSRLIGNQYYADIILTATEDNTSITILPRSNLMGHPANVPFTITLNKGQTYVCRSSEDNPAQRPGGTIVTSNRPICISISDDSLYYPNYTCADTAGDQLIPDNNSGQDFVVQKGYLYGSDIYYVFALEDNTRISVNGVVQATIDAGDFYTGSLADLSCYVEANKNVHLFHVSGFGCELGGAVVPALKCTGSTTVSVTRATTQDFFVNIISPTSQISGFTFNGDPNIITASQFTSVPGTNGEWMCGRFSIPVTIMNAGTSARIENSLGKFHLGIIHGDQGSTTRYGFFSDFAKTRFKLDNMGFYCKDTDVTITASYTGGTNFTWESPSGRRSQGPVLRIPRIQPSGTGLYTVSADAGGCGTVTQTIYVDIQQFTPSVTTPPNVCFSAGSVQLESNTTLNGGSISKHEWFLSDGSTLSGRVVTHQLTRQAPLNVKLVETSSAGCKDSIQTSIDVLPSKQSDTNRTICEGDNFWGYTQTGIYQDIFSAANGCDSIRNLNLTVLPIARSTVNKIICDGETFLGYSSTGTYVDRFRAANGCDSIRTLNLEVKQDPSPSILLTGNNLNICEGSFVWLTGAGGASYQWYLNGNAIQGSTSSTYQATQPGIYSLEAISSEGCKGITTSNPVLTLLRKPAANFSANSACIGNPLTFSNTSVVNASGPVSYFWTFGDGGVSSFDNPTHTYLRGGTFPVKLKVWSVNCPILIDSISSFVFIDSPRAGVRYPTINTLININTPLKARNFGNSYLWQPSRGLSRTDIYNPVFNYNADVDYLIRIGMPSGCITYDSILVRVSPNADILVPTAFSPNRDGVNDYLDVFTLGIRKIHFRVYNRWGQLMFETRDITQRWDGNFQGKPQPLENYVWVADAETMSGQIIRKRGQTVLIR